jgi:hypothetical protein
MMAILGESLDLGRKLRVYCREGKGSAMKKHRACTASIDADLETLVRTRGRDFPIGWLSTRVKCPRCHSRHVVIAFEPPASPARMRHRDVGWARYRWFGDWLRRPRRKSYFGVWAGAGAWAGAVALGVATTDIDTLP